MNILQLRDLKDNVSLIFNIRSTLKEIIQNLFDVDIPVDDVEVSLAKEERLGDFTSNVAFKISKIVGDSPVNIATKIKDVFKNDQIGRVEVNGGFLNFFLEERSLLKNLEEILRKEDLYGYWELAKGKKVMVEFGQPNTHKAVTAGHVKSAVTGLSVSRLLEVLGFEVIKANYYSDIGLNAAKTTWAFMKSYSIDGLDRLNLSEKMRIIAGCYSYAHKQYKLDKDTAKEIQTLNATIYKKSDEDTLYCYEYLKRVSLESQKEMFEKLGIVYDREYAESETVEIAKKIVMDNLNKVFVEDDGAIIFPGERFNLNRWVFVNSMGLPTYSAKDLGLASIKFQEYPDLEFALILTSTEQSSYFCAVIKALELVSADFKNKYYFWGFGWLLRNNKKMNSKSGNAVSVEQLFSDAYELAKNKITSRKDYTQEEINLISEKVFLSGLKFLFLSRELHMDINYDPNQFLDYKGFSGPYVLYSYVRSKSILRSIKELGVQIEFTPTEVNASENQFSEMEISLLRMMYTYPYVAFNAAKNISPHLIANYLYNLCQKFNKFYKDHRVISSEGSVYHTRAFIVKAFSIIVKNGLYLLGIETVEKM